MLMGCPWQGKEAHNARKALIGLLALAAASAAAVAVRGGFTSICLSYQQVKAWQYLIVRPNCNADVMQACKHTEG